jgi:hypothetical protein
MTIMMMMMKKAGQIGQLCSTSIMAEVPRRLIFNRPHLHHLHHPPTLEEEEELN